MTEAVPLAVTALLPFLVLPLAGVSTAGETASDYYSPILFLLLGGAYIALAIEADRTASPAESGDPRNWPAPAGVRHACFAGLHDRCRAAFDASFPNTSTALIMNAVALAVLEGGGDARNAGDAVRQDGIFGAYADGIAFAASIGGLGTIVGSPTNAIAVGLLDTIAGVRISFVQMVALWRAD